MSFEASSRLSVIANYFLTAINDRNGNTLTTTRDSGQNITEMSSASGKLSFSVDFNTGRIQKITDQGGRSVSYQYDAAGRLIKVIDPLGQEMSYSYDANNQLLTTSNQRGIVDASRTYDANGRITQEQYADGSVMQFVYTLINDTAPQGGLTATKVIDPNGHTHTYRIDTELYTCSVADSFNKQSLVDRQLGTNRTKSVTDRLGRVTLPTFDAKENLTQIKAPDGSVTKYSYESTFNLPTAVTDSLNKTSTIMYDAKGNPIEIKDALGKVSKLTYDPNGQVTSVI